MADVFYKLAVGVKTIAQMLSEPEFKDFPPQTPEGYVTGEMLILENWQSPDKTRTVFIRAEERLRTLGGRNQLRGYALARWSLPFFTWAKLKYLHDTFFTTDDDYAQITLQMPSDFGSSADMITYYGYLWKPWPTQTMQKPRASVRGGLGWSDVIFEFFNLRPSS